MADLVSELTERARALPIEQRARLAEQILATLDPQDEDVEAAWDEEIRKRIDEIETGAVKTVPAEQAFAQVRQALRR
jgi:putative addiction module component (TIGR02574 family)